MLNLTETCSKKMAFFLWTRCIFSQWWTTSN